MPEDRDQLFERALARHLRAESAGESLCLDPETLAAYHERMLRPEELASAKSHIVSCARCQEVLAQLERTQETNGLEEVPDEATAAKPGALPGPAPRVSPEPQASKAPVPLAVVRHKKALSLRWAAPAGAVAAGLLIWIVARDARFMTRQSSESATQIARDRPQPSSLPRQEAEEFSLRKDKDSGMSADSEKQQPAAGYAGDLNQKVGRTRGERTLPPSLFDEKDEALAPGKPLREKKSSPAYEYSVRTGAADPRGPSAAAAQAQANNALQRGDQGAAGGAVEVIPPARGFEQRQPAAPPPPSVAKADDFAAAGPAAPPPARDQNQPAAGKSNLESKNAEVTSAFKAPVYSRAVSKLSLDIRITAPGGKQIWSVGPGGQIMHSGDAGRTWLLQMSGVSANLTGGSAPSGKVCWIAGASGTLLRTTDGGNHWQEIHVPFAGDLGGVHASDAEHASISDPANRARYETSDGGVTWRQSAKE